MTKNNLETAKDMFNSSQVILVNNKKNSINTGTLQAFEYENGNFEVKFGPRDCILGKNGIAQKGKKYEGDGKTPQGIFSLKRSFGTHRLINGNFPYFQTTEKDIRVDDITSPEYNTHIHLTDSYEKSFETLKRNDHLYNIGIIVEYNTENIVAGNGSAIFIHVWRSPESNGTDGCVAISEEKLKEIIERLKLDNNPCIVIEAV